MRVLKDEIVDTVEMTQARTGAVFNLYSALQLSIVVTGSGASTPVGTSAQLQVSNDNVNWVSLGSAVSITTNVSAIIPAADCIVACTFQYGRVAYAWGSGAINYSTRVTIKGEAM